MLLQAVGVKDKLHLLKLYMNQRKDMMYFNKQNLMYTPVNCINNDMNSLDRTNQTLRTCVLTLRPVCWPVRV